MHHAAGYGARGHTHILKFAAVCIVCLMAILCRLASMARGTPSWTDGLAAISSLVSRGKRCSRAMLADGRAPQQDPKVPGPAQDQCIDQRPITQKVADFPALWKARAVQPASALARLDRGPPGLWLSAYTRPAWIRFPIRIFCRSHRDSMHFRGAQDTPPFKRLNIQHSFAF